MKRSAILLIDSIINFMLGVLLLFYPKAIVEFIGIPLAESAFYPGILGSVLVGIAVALFMEWKKENPKFIGLGTGGAIVINLCAAIVLTAWLLFGSLEIPLKGHVVLWGLAILIIIISIIEIINIRRS